MGKRKFSRFQAVVLAAGAVYMLVVVLATLYSQTIYVEKLPAVVLAPLDETRGGYLRGELVEEQEDGTWLVNTVERVDGPWGGKYIVKQVRTSAAQPLPGGRIRVFELTRSENPVVASSSEPLYAGMEVRVVSGLE